MTISQQQFKQLNAMGIKLWQRKSFTSPKSELLAQLKNSQLFSDVLFCLDIPFNQLCCENNQVTLADLTWQFTDKKTVHYQDKLLTTPELCHLKSSISLKANLWQVIQQYKLL